MLTIRLALALDTGAIVFPDTGAIAIINPGPDSDLSLLPKNRTRIVQRHFPAFRSFEARGLQVEPVLSTTPKLAVICLPRSKAEARGAIAAVARRGVETLVIDGQKTDGIDSILKALRKSTDVQDVISKAHGKLIVCSGNGDFGDWTVPESEPIEGRFRTVAGVFSADGIDPASQALANVLSDKMTGNVVDLGAGWGFLSDRVLQNPKITQLDLVEADHVALDCARTNISDPRAVFHWADALTFKPNQLADHIVTNPPFHTSRAADPALGQGFIRAAASMLSPKGTLWLVANRHLPYEKTLQDAFREIKSLGSTPQFKLYAAALPKKDKR